MKIIFVGCVCVLIVASAVTAARPRTTRQWTLVWLLVVFLAWALLGVGWLRSA